MSDHITKFRKLICDEAVRLFGKDVRAEQLCEFVRELPLIIPLNKKKRKMIEIEQETQVPAWARHECCGDLLPVPNLPKIEVNLFQDILGLSHFSCKNGWIYSAEDVLAKVKNPAIIGRKEKSKDGYVFIPTEVK